MMFGAWLRAALLGLMVAACVPSSGCWGHERGREPLSERFDHAVIDPAPDAGEECCTDVAALADVDGDGRLDVLIGGEHAREFGFAWYRAPEWDRHPIAAGDFTTDCAAVDFDGDGDLDVVTGGRIPAGSSPLGVYLLENPGRADAVWPTRRLSDDAAHDVEAADLDGDGRPEIFVRTKHALVLLGAGRSGAVRRRVIFTEDGEGIAVGDIDADGRPDVVAGASWLAGAASPFRDDWVRHQIFPDLDPDSRVRIADLSGDGRADLVMTSSEGTGSVLWFEAPRDPRTSPWKRHAIDEDELEGAHSLGVADMDNDGDLDIVTAEMHKSKRHRVLVYLREALGWSREIVSYAGSHNLQLGDLDGDGDIDILGKNYAGRGRSIEMWRNRTRNVAGVLALDRWSYFAIDDDRPASEKGKTGLVFSDLDGDGLRDVLAGGFAYRNPGGDLSGAWRRTTLPDGFDPLFELPVGDERVVLGIVADTLVELGAGDRSQLREIGVVSPGRTQGRAVGRLEPGGPIVGVFTRAHDLLLVRPDSRGWSVELLSASVEEEGVALGDIDGDGDTDIIAQTRREERNEVHWLENRRASGLSWLHRAIGSGEHLFDRVAAADIDGDGDLDVVCSEETGDLEHDASVYWFERPADPRALGWTRHTIVTLRSVNSMSVADFDGDGDPDLAIAEHTDFARKPQPDDNLTLILENLGRGSVWRGHRVDRGPRSSHLGALAEDLDRDGDLDLVSIAWQQFTHVHLWRNDAPCKQAAVAD